jgi:sugar/nucleoside kinase (ribokinase family)
MPVVVVGSVAFDTIETPTTRRERCLGGSATYFALAARLLTEVKLVGVVGEDFPAESRAALERDGIDLGGLETVAGETFFWSGRYFEDMNSRETLELRLGVFEHFDPEVPSDYRSVPYVFLANGSPEIQLGVLEQCSGPELAVADTMDHWIRDTRPGVDALVERVDGIVLNDDEAKLYTREHSAVLAARAILERGPRFVVVKKGEHGVLAMTREATVALPAYPTRRVIDPTGAGDSFAGGMMGVLAREGLSVASLRKALAFGTAVASITVESIGVDAIAAATSHTVGTRLNELRDLVSF